MCPEAIKIRVLCLVFVCTWMKMIAGMENMCFWLVCCILVLFPSHSSACKAACYPPANLQAELPDASIYQLNNSTTLEQSVLAGRCFALCLKRVRHIICVVLILPYFNFYICSTKTSSGHRYVHHYFVIVVQPWFDKLVCSIPYSS